MNNLNPGICKTVAWLNEHGFPTCDSGDGKTHAFDCDRPYAYVVVRLNPDCYIEDEAHRLAEMLEGRGVKISPMSDRAVPQIQATYDPADEYAFLELLHVDDALLFPRPAKPRKCACDTDPIGMEHCDHCRPDKKAKTK